MVTPVLLNLYKVSHYKYFSQLVGHILTLKRFSIELTTILVGYLLNFQQRA